VEFEYDQKNTLYVRIDRKRKFLGTIFLRALGLRTDEEILKTFYTVDTIKVKDGKLQLEGHAREASPPTCRARAGPRHHRQGRRDRPRHAQEDRRTPQAAARRTRSPRVEVRPASSTAP
jgi:DNA-directed RNA polymerase beta subunit